MLSARPERATRVLCAWVNGSLISSNKRIILNIFQADKGLVDALSHGTALFFNKLCIKMKTEILNKTTKNKKPNLNAKKYIKKIEKKC